MDDTLQQIKEIVDEEIQAYESLGDLYTVKQSILVQGKSDALWDVDAQIISRADIIRSINQKRKNLFKYMGDENMSMSQIIEKAKASNEPIVENLEMQRTKLRILAKSLSLQEKTNMSLIKHGLTMVGKSIEIIVGAVMPELKRGHYNSSGHNVDMDKSEISSIVEEV